MALNESQQLQRSTLIIYVDETGKKTDSGKNIVKLLPYVGIQPVDANGNPSGTLYYQPMSWPLPLLAPGAEPPVVVIEQRQGTVRDFHEYQGAQV